MESAASLLTALAGVRATLFKARSAHSEARRGRGRVRVAWRGPDAVVFHETGDWLGSTRSTRFRDVLLWTAAGEHLQLSHGRQGLDALVPLASFQRRDRRAWIAAAAHRCGDDEYHPRLLIGDRRIVLRWTVRGPRKAEVLTKLYRSDALTGAAPATVPFGSLRTP